MVPQVRLLVVCYIVDPTLQNVLLTYPQSFGEWLPPGGQVKPKESTYNALVRAVRDETGLTVGDDLLVMADYKLSSYCHVAPQDPQPLFCDEYASADHLYASNIFYAVFTKQSIANPIPDEQALEWIPSTELSALDHAFEPEPLILRAGRIHRRHIVHSLRATRYAHQNSFGRTY